MGKENPFVLWKYFQAGWDKDEVGATAEGGDLPGASWGTQPAHNPSGCPTMPQAHRGQALGHPSFRAPTISLLCALEQAPSLHISISLSVRWDRHLSPSGVVCR